MKLIWFFLSFIILVPPVFADTFAPPDGKTLLLIGQDSHTIARYVSVTGQTPGGTMFYTSVQEATGLTMAADYGAGPQYGDALLQYPHSVVQIGLYMVGALEKTAAGGYDAHLLSLAQWIKKARRPVYLRIGYEFDSPGNHYDPAPYIQAFRHVVDFLRSQGVRNAAYVWHSYCGPEKPGQSWMDWYPGDDYVDWFGASVFSTPTQIWTASKFLKLARARHKPFMIAESTPVGVYTRLGKLDWLGKVFHFIEEENIEAFCYIDSNWDRLPMYQTQHFGDARIEADDKVKDFWLEQIHKDRFLSASPDLFPALGGED